MNTSLLSILKQPLDSNLVKAVFQKFEIEKREKIHYYANGATFKGDGWYNKNTDLFIGFETTLKNVKCVSQITIEPANGILTVDFPFGLSLKDNKEDIIAKLGRKPKSKSKSSLVSKDPELYQYAWWFEIDDKKILTALNGYYELLWLRVIPFSEYELKMREFEKTLQHQNRNINLVVDFSTCLKQSPCLRWRESLEENELLYKQQSEDYIEGFWFNDYIINSTEECINRYLEKLKSACSKKSSLKVYNAVKWFVEKMNNLNRDNDYFIETLERDELGQFIDSTIIQTGFKRTGNLDITQQWREW